jgi:hypothetical protein
MTRSEHCWWITPASCWAPDLKKRQWVSLMVGVVRSLIGGWRIDEEEEISWLCHF